MTGVSPVNERHLDEHNLLEKKKERSDRQRSGDEVIGREESRQRTW